MPGQLSFAKPIHEYRGRRQGRRWFVVLFFSALVLAGFVVFALIYGSASRPLDEKADTQTVVIESGLGTPEIGQQLLNDGLVSSSMAFTAAVFFEGARGDLQAGTYELSAAQSPRQIVELLRDGRTRELRVTIPEGLRIDQIAELLDDENIVGADEFERAAREEYDFAFLQSKPEGYDLEGFLFPDTYHFKPGVSAHEVIETMLTNFEDKIEDLLPAFEQDDRSLFEILTLASIVEREVATPEDRANAAGVFINRIENDIPLQSDITLSYVLKEDKRDYSLAETEIDDPYNTYLYEGLPPGPIDSPGLSAIEAALSPAEHKYFYFLSDLETGNTYFAETLEEHNENVEKYLSD